MKNLIFILFLFWGMVSAQAQNLNTFFSKADAFLKANVANGKVAYNKIHNDPSALNAVLKIAQGIRVSKTDAKNYQAFWINAYNLSVIKGLVDHYPTKSPLSHAGFFDKMTHNLGGKSITLNDIEHKLLRGQFHDARFHFVLVCGAIGCPPLISRAYKPNTLEAQLEAQTKKAMNGNFVHVNEKKKRVQVSQIMQWYKDDFKSQGKDEIDFINKYRTQKLEGKYKLGYFTYNWDINKQ